MIGATLKSGAGAIGAGFFDRVILQDAIDRAALRALSKFGAYVRRKDKSSLRYRKAPSAPGGPPSVHRSPTFTREKKKKGRVVRQPSSPLRELTFFAYDANRKSVVIGPAIFRGSKIGGGKAPITIEEGGTIKILSDGKLKVAKYAARPHTLPAFNAVLPQAPAMFANQVRK